MNAAARNLPSPAACYHTEVMDLAAAILAAEALAYLRAENVGSGRVTFVFADPERRGPRLELDYNRGQFATVQPLSLFRCKMVLQDAIRTALQPGGGRTYDGRTGNR